MGAINRLFMWFGRQSSKYQALKRDEEKRRDSVHFGVKSILFIVIGFTVSAAIVFGGVLMIGSKNVFFVILGIALAAAGGVCVLLFFIRSLYCSVLQMKLNKKIIGVLSLIFCLAVTAGVIVAAFLILNSI